MPAKAAQESAMRTRLLPPPYPDHLGNQVEEHETQKDQGPDMKQGAGLVPDPGGVMGDQARNADTDGYDGGGQKKSHWFLPVGVLIPQSAYGIRKSMHY